MLTHSLRTKFDSLILCLITSCLTRTPPRPAYVPEKTQISAALEQLGERARESVGDARLCSAPQVTLKIPVKNLGVES